MVQRKKCRSRQELSNEYSNEYLLAKFGFDTAENEPPKGSKKCMLQRTLLVIALFAEFYRSKSFPSFESSMSGRASQRNANKCAAEPPCPRDRVHLAALRWQYDIRRAYDGNEYTYWATEYGTKKVMLCPPGTAISDRIPTVKIARFLLAILWPPSARICQTLRILSNEIE